MSCICKKLILLLFEWKLSLLSPAITIKVCVNRVPPNEVTNKDIMSTPIITISSDSSPSVAADMMLQHNVIHLLVVDKSSTNNPIGIITPLDFTRYQEYPNVNDKKDTIEKILEYYI